MPHRLIPFHCIENCRDVGGYPTRDGRTVRRGRVYRSDAPFGIVEPAGADAAPSRTPIAELLAADGPRFTALGIRTVIDLRRPDELAAFGRLPDGFGFTVHGIDLDPTPWPLTDPEAEEMPRYLSGHYLRLAEASTGGNRPVGRAFALLADERCQPVMFHCSAGKDRTGVLAALTLALLGVDDADIADDYALSRLARRRHENWLREAAERGVIAPGWIRNPAPPEAILLFLAGLRQRYGSIEQYAEKAGVTAATLAGLRHHLLE